MPTADGAQSEMTTSISIKICPWTQKGINKSISILYCLQDDKNKLVNDKNRNCSPSSLSGAIYRFYVVLSYFILNELKAGWLFPFSKCGTHTSWPMVPFYVYLCVSMRIKRESGKVLSNFSEKKVPKKWDNERDGVKCSFFVGAFWFP